MLRIIREKFLRLGRDEEGVAMVVTLAIFMFMYLVCMGVYAIGTAVKTRIHLQNACDAAAYSAAVVQADTLSRIATINRAMSWTYVQMTRRQMDYIVYKWLEETCVHHQEDALVAKTYTKVHNECEHGAPPCSICTVRYIGWDIKDIALNGKGSYSEEDLRKAFDVGLLGNMSKWSDSFDSSPITHDDLLKQIKKDLATISEMNRANRTLAQELPEKIDKVVREIGKANRPDVDWEKDCYIAQSKHPISDYIEIPKNTSENEKRFISFSSKEYLNLFRAGNGVAHQDIFDKGIDDWFVRGEGGYSESGDGFHRSYNHERSGGGGPLKASWEWYSTGWTCGEAYKVHWMFPSSYAGASECNHGHDLCSCNGEGESGELTGNYIDRVSKRHRRIHRHHTYGGIVGKWVSAVCYADNDKCYEGEGGEHGYKGKLWDGASKKYVAIYARPYVLTSEYFKSSGTITVVVAIKNQNPWASILGTAIKGIFSAFNIGKDNPYTPQYTVCIASAKAGYRYLDGVQGVDENGKDINDDERAYRIDWRGSEDDWAAPKQSWNLCQSDWDAVLIPVRRAETFATEGSWNNDVGNFLDGYLRRIVSPNDMVAGGDGLDVSKFYEGRDLGEEYRFGTIGNDGVGFWRGADLPDGRTTGDVRAKWQIGKPNNPIDWNGLQKVMFH